MELVNEPKDWIASLRKILEKIIETGYKNTWIHVSMVNGMKYMPDCSAYERVTWEAQRSMLMPGSAERWVERVSGMPGRAYEKRKEPEMNLATETNSREAIDFSCKHDILIRHKDGNMTPMDEPYYEVKQIAPDTWQIMSSGDYHYLVVGDEIGVSIDTGYGAGNLRAFLESLCGKPVPWCINTHHHFDHSANNCYFDLVYMAEESVPYAAVPYPSFDGIDFPRDYPVQTVSDGNVIPLKGRKLEIFKIGDHTPGGIAILDRKQRLLFSGDEIMPGGKMLSGSVKKFARDMGKLMAVRGDFDTLCGGPDMLPGDRVALFHEAAQKILAGELTPVKDEPWRGGPPPFDAPDGKKVYDCQMPHPEDAPGGPMRKKDGQGDGKPPMGERVKYVYGGQYFICDPAKIHG